MTFGRETRTDTSSGTLADNCRRAHAEIDRFLDWACYHRPRKRAEWRTWASERLRDGWSLDATVQRVKDAWFEHCRATGRSFSRGTTHQDLMARLFEVVNAVRDDSLSAAESAVLVRQIARDFPDHVWVAQFAERLASGGFDPWRAWDDIDDEGFDYDSPRQQRSLTTSFHEPL